MEYIHSTELHKRITNQSEPFFIPTRPKVKVCILINSHFILNQYVELWVGLMPVEYRLTKREQLMQTFATLIY